jgi:hypothetical protein
MPAIQRMLKAYLQSQRCLVHMRKALLHLALDIIAMLEEDVHLSLGISNMFMRGMAQMAHINRMEREHSTSIQQAELMDSILAKIRF